MLVRYRAPSVVRGQRLRCRRRALVGVWRWRSHRTVRPRDLTAGSIALAQRAAEHLGGRGGASHWSVDWRADGPVAVAHDG